MVKNLMISIVTMRLQDNRKDIENVMLNLIGY